MNRIIILIFFLTLPGFAQTFLEAEHGEQPNHLEPVNPNFSDYRKRISEELLVTRSDHGLMISRPSFGGESAVAIYETISQKTLAKHDNLSILVPNKQKKFYITCTQAEESLWYSMPDNNQKKEFKKVKIKRHDLQISPQLAIAIQRAWGRMLLHTRYPEKAYMGLDGITYEFGVFVRGLGYLQGDIWTPDSGLPAEMAKLGNKLQQIAIEGKPLTPKQEAQIIKGFSKFESLTKKP